VISDGVKSCQFFTCEQAIAWVIQAYGDAIAACTPPEGELWFSEGIAWADREEFMAATTGAFARRLLDWAQRCRVLPPSSEMEPDIASEEPDFCALQELGLPQCDSMAAIATVDGDSSC
jgi:hypothetical protein